MKKENLFQISINLDEISSDFQESLDFLVKNNVKYTEIRTINGKNIVQYSDNEIKHFSNVIQGCGLKISAIASPLFKWFTKNETSDNSVDLFGMEPHINFESKKQLIDKTILCAKILKTKHVRIFSGLYSHEFSVITNEDKQLIQYLLNQAKKAKVTIALENEPVCKVFTFKSYLETLSNSEFSGLKAWFDIGNLYEIGENLSEKQIVEISPFIEYLHIKDPVAMNKHEFVALGEGIINYKRIFTDLSNHLKNPIFLSLETHAKKNKLESTQKSLDYLRQIIQTPRIKYALVGAGRISAKHNVAYKLNSNSELRGVFDINPEKSLIASKNFDTHNYSSLDELLADPTIDIVSICTPHDTHISIATSVVNSDKYALVEKPFTTDFSKAKGFLSEKKYNDKTFVVFQNLHNRPVQQLLDLNSKGALGNLHSFTLTIRWWRDNDYFKDWHGNEKISGGLLFTQAIHSIELLSHLTELKLKNVVGSTWKSRTNLPSNDMAQALVTLENGAKGIIDVCLATQKQNIESSLFTVWDKGCVKIGGLALSEDSYTFSEETGIISQQSFDSNDDYFGNGHISLIKSLSDFILQKPESKGKNLIHPSQIEETIDFTRKLYDAIKRA